MAEDTPRMINVGTPYAGIAQEIADLGEFKRRGVVTEDEFNEAKKRLLNLYPPVAGD